MAEQHAQTANQWFVERARLGRSWFVLRLAGTRSCDIEYLRATKQERRFRTRQAAQEVADKMNAAIATTKQEKP